MEKSFGSTGITSVQKQKMKFSQKQMALMDLVALGNIELREAILKKVEENPALEIVNDNFSVNNQKNVFLKTNKENDSTTFQKKETKIESEEASEKYQKMLESIPDKEETLHKHLFHQLYMLNLNEKEKKLCEKLIENLDDNGFYLLAPVSLLKIRNRMDEQLLQKCIDIVRHLDPEGICVENIEKSLLLQAKLKKNAPKLSLFFLNGRLEMLDPPIAEEVLKKLNTYIEENSKLSFRSKESIQNDFSKEELSINKIEEAIKFIQSLNPVPTRNFKPNGNNLIQSEVFVTVDKETKKLKIHFSDSFIPEVAISKDYKIEKNDKTLPEETRKLLKKQVYDATNFIALLNFRKQIVTEALKKIVIIQKEFFYKGPGNLVPLSQVAFSKMIGVHNSTVSRMANQKYITCDWGTFPVKYLFFNSYITKNNYTINQIYKEIEDILKNQKPGEKKLSDQKITDILLQKGIKIARRTVAKYRAKLRDNPELTRKLIK